MKKRIQSIMVRQIRHKLNPAGKLLLAAAGFAVLAFPVLAGILYTPAGRAQAQDAPKPTLFSRIDSILGLAVKPRRRRYIFWLSRKWVPNFSRRKMRMAIR